ncbi:MAG: hypothetical protein ABR548_07615 [Actinomycetota bacterium]
MRRILMSIAVLVALASVSFVPALAGPGSGPDASMQALLDGCQRSDAQILTLTTPEWVYVKKADILAARATSLNSHPERQTATGVVRDIHPAGDDLFINHDFNDVDIDIAPDDASKGLVERFGNSLTSEWEEALIPPWAWPQIGDTVKESGSWIWDCGHWQDHSPYNLMPYDPYETGQDLYSPGESFGEGTELHPLYEMAVTREATDELGSYGARRLKRLDSWINGDGGWAAAEEECTLLGIPPAGGHGCPRLRDVAGAYSYDITLPPKPSPGSVLVINPPVVHSAESNVSVSDLSAIPAAGDKVHVSFTIPPGNGQRFGVSVEAGWSDDSPAVAHHLTIDDVHIIHSLDRSSDDDSEPSLNPVNNGPEQTQDPAEWVMFASVNGEWKQVPGLAQVSHGATVTGVGGDPLVSFDFYTIPGVAPRFFVSARECDIPLVDCASDIFLGTPSAIPFSEIGYNDHPGRIQDPSLYHRGQPLTASGTYTLSPNTSGAGYTVEDKPDDKCDSKCYEVTVTLS